MSMNGVNHRSLYLDLCGEYVENNVLFSTVALKGNLKSWLELVLVSWTLLL